MLSKRTRGVTPVLAQKVRGLLKFEGICGSENKGSLKTDLLDVTKTSIHNGRCALSSRDERTAGTTRRGRTNTTSSSMVAHCGRGCLPHCIGHDGGIVAHGGSCRRGAPRWRTPLTCTTRRSGRQGAQRDAGRVTDSAGNNEGD